MGAKPPRLASAYEAVSYTESAWTKACKYSYFVLMFVLVIATVLAFVGVTAYFWAAWSR